MPTSPQLPSGPSVAMFEADEASNRLGMRLLEVGDGTATVQMTIGPTIS